MGYMELELDQLQGLISRVKTTKSRWSPADKDVFYKMPPLEWWTWVGIIIILFR